MSTGVVVQTRAVLERERGAREGCGDDGLALGQSLDGVFECLAAEGFAECPVCRGTMRPSGEAALCSRCGSTLA